MAPPGPNTLQLWSTVQDRAVRHMAVSLLVYYHWLAMDWKKELEDEDDEMELAE